MPGGKETTEVQFSPQRERFLGNIFGSQPGGDLGALLGLPGQPGTGLGAGLEQIFGAFGPSPVTSPLQRQATNQIGQFLNQQAPELQAFQQAQQALSPILSGQGQFGNVADALTPIFERNLQTGIANLSAAAPGRFNSAFAQQGANLAQQGLQDFNLFVEQARQQDIQNRLQSALGLGTLAQSAGQNPFNRLFNAGQLGLQESQQLFNQQAFPFQNRLALQQAILQLLGQPTGQTTSSSGGIGGALGAVIGTGLGAGVGALGAGLGGAAVDRILR